MPDRSTKKTVQRRPGTLVTTIMHSIGSDILRGTYPEGSILPPEAKLAELLGVGKGTIREAVKSLTSKGLLEVSRGRGTTVLAEKHWVLIDPDVIQWAGEDVRFLSQLGEFRMAIEPAAAELAASKITRTEGAFLLASLEEMEGAAEGTESAINADVTFHRLILEATHNAFFISLRHMLLPLLRKSFSVSIVRPHAYRDGIVLHQRLAEAICGHAGKKARDASEVLVAQHRRDVTKQLAKRAPMQGRR